MLLIKITLTYTSLYPPQVSKASANLHADPLSLYKKNEHHSRDYCYDFKILEKLRFHNAELFS